MKWNNFVVDFYAIRKNKQTNKYLTIWFKLLCMCMYVYTHTHTYTSTKPYYLVNFEVYLIQ